MPDEEECIAPGVFKFSRREDAEGPGGPLEKRMALTGRDYEVKVCPCGYYHIVEVKQ